MKKNSKSVIIIIAILVFAGIYGVNNLDYVLNGDTKEIYYRASQVIFNEVDNNESNNPKNENNQDDEYTFADNGDLKVYYFNVGQADSVLLSNGGQNMLIDAGNNADGKLIVKELQELGITKLDYAIGTHAHEDHIGGMDYVINNFDIGKYFMPKKTTNTKNYEDVLKALSNKKLKVTTPKVGDTFYLGSAKCEVMGIDNESESLNENSIILQVTYGNKKFLFTGDAESTNEASRNWEDIDVLKVGHHGSSSSTSSDFLEQTKPEYAIISCGINNDYGHPHKETIQKLKKIETYRTDKDGTILVTCDGNNLEFEKLNINLDGNK